MVVLVLFGKMVVLVMAARASLPNRRMSIEKMRIVVLVLFVKKMVVLVMAAQASRLPNRRVLVEKMRDRKSVV